MNNTQLTQEQQYQILKQNTHKHKPKAGMQID
jgi:hypothetical protein